MRRVGNLSKMPAPISDTNERQHRERERGDDRVEQVGHQVVDPGARPADVDADRHVEARRLGEERQEVGVAEQALAIGAAYHHADGAEPLSASELGDRARHVVERDRRDPLEALGADRALLGDPGVVGAAERLAELRVDGQLRRDEQRRIDDLEVDALLLDVAKPLLDVAHLDARDVLGLPGADLGARRAEAGRGAEHVAAAPGEAREQLILDHPEGPPRVGADDLRPARPVRGLEVRVGERLRALLDVPVGVDDVDGQAHGVNAAGSKTSHRR